MSQPLQHPIVRVVVFDRRGELLPREQWPEYARRYQQDQQWLAEIARDGGPILAREWEPPPCDTEPRE